MFSLLRLTKAAYFLALAVIVMALIAPSFSRSHAQTFRGPPGLGLAGIPMMPPPMPLMPLNNAMTDDVSGMGMMGMGGGMGMGGMGKK